ncbi:hypothetical protein OUZ56_000369 [Daphnia magna]|uniref:Uncharacterized protein n=1 Tax=Daphnia magna TaxID=35525 RepID=A0ABQ9ZZM1_9CRUS|nr:hypothetical protein OUZ56_000369 [Daphnia magna]
MWGFRGIASRVAHIRKKKKRFNGVDCCCPGCRNSIPGNTAARQTDCFEISPLEFDGISERRNQNKAEKAEDKNALDTFQMYYYLRQND